jgi:hypothetical protein
MQLEAHCIENIKNSREVWLYWITRKRTMKARPRKPRFPRKVRDIVKTGRSANGMTNFGDIRLLEGLIYEIGSRLSGARLWAGRGPDRFLRHVTLQQNRPAFLPAYFIKDYVIGRGQYPLRSVRRNRRSGS